MRRARSRFTLVAGFTLIELAISLVVLGLIALLIMQLLPALTDRTRLDHTGAELEAVSEAVAGFALANNRLPCPDTNGDGFEGSGGCGAADEVGLLPFRAMGLPGPAVDEARRPLRYGVYRNAGDAADLARLVELFEPAMPDSLSITPGTVSGCNETLDPPQTIIIYDLPPATTLRVDVESGTFEDEEFVGFFELDLVNVAAAAPPAPLDTPLDAGESIYCPCGSTSDPGPPITESCNICTASFTPGKFTVPLEAHFLTSDTSDDVPVGQIRDVFGSTVLGFPGGGFVVGDTIAELFNPVDILLFPQPVRQVVDPASDDPGTDEFDPTGTTDTDNLLTGVTGEVAAVEEKSAFVVEDGVTNVDFNTVDLAIEIPRFNPPPPFVAGDRVYGASSGAVGTVVSQTTVELEFDDDTPESVTSSSGGTATIQAGTDTGSTFVVDGSITGSISGFDDQGNPGDTITGDISGTVADVIRVVTSDSSTPVTARGSIEFNAVVSAQTNELDFCQGLRNAIAAAGDTGATSFVHTVNDDAVVTNPAYLLVSGGVEDADGNMLDGSFDQRNEITVVTDFESPARLRDDSAAPARVYDDVVRTEPMNVLADRLACARNLGAVNALAVDATVQRNIAELAFNNNEQALAVIELGWRGRELAQLNLELEAAQLALNAAGLAITIYQAISDFEGVASIVAVSLAIANLAGGIASLVSVAEAFNAADSGYAAACISQQGTAAALIEAITAAEEALALALRADAWGGVR